MSETIIGLVGTLPPELKSAALLILIFATWKGGAWGVEKVKERNGKSRNTKHAVEDLGNALIPVLKRIEDRLGEVSRELHEQFRDSRGMNENLIRILTKVEKL